MSFMGRWRDFWRRVSEGLTLQQLWAQFRREAGASYRHYRVELGDEHGSQPRLRRWFRLAGALFWAMVLKLSPPRRVFLLVALVLLAAGLGGGQGRGTPIVGALALLVLLGLELADRVAMKRDLEIAREIQGWLVPQSPPIVAGVDIAFATRPANTVAGDYYDAFLCPAGTGGAAPRLLVVIADVAGKGMPAALLMATFQSSLRTLAQEPIPLGELVVRLNRYCCEHSLEGRRFTTAVIAELDPASGALAYVNAGHNPPALRRGSGRIESLETGGLPLGIQAGAGYETGELTLTRGDRLVVYTDGVVEAQNARQEEYGEARLMELLRGGAEESAAETLRRMLSSVDAFVGDAARFDDVTCLVLRYATA
jgi:sigma-B regulation protein RsbU (phosphoserine phosphatase)